MPTLSIVREATIRLPARDCAKLIEDILTAPEWERLRLSPLTREGHRFAVHARDARAVRDAACIDVVATSNALSQPIYGAVEVRPLDGDTSELLIRFEVNLNEQPTALDHVLRDSLSYFADALKETLAAAGEDSQA